MEQKSSSVFIMFEVYKIIVKKYIQLKEGRGEEVS